MAKSAARMHGIDSGRIVSVEHPIGGIEAEALDARASDAADAILDRIDLA